MEQETYEKIIEVLVAKLKFTEWSLKQAEEKIIKLQQEQVGIRSEK